MSMSVKYEDRFVEHNGECQTFKTDDGTIPSTFVMKNGKVKVQKSGSLSYYRIAELFK